MSSEQHDLNMKLRLLDAVKFRKAVRSSTKDIKGTGDAASRAGGQGRRGSKDWDRYGRSARGAGRETRTLRSSMAGTIKTMAGFGAAYLGISQLKGSIDATKDLASSTMAMNRALGAGAPKDAAESYAAIFASRGIDSNKGVMAFKKLSSQMVAAGNGSKTARKQFKQLGISQKWLAENGNDVDAVTRRVGNSLSKMDNGARKTALGNQLFGKSYNDMIKIIGGGSDSMDEEIKKLRDYGVIQGKGTEGAAELMKAQRESKSAMLGLQITLGTQLIPVVLKLAQVFPQLVNKIKTGDGPFKTIRDTITTVWNALKSVVDWFSNSEDATNGLIYALTALGAAWAVQKVVNFVNAVRKLWLVTKLMTVAQIALNVVMRANPIVLAVTAIIALGAAFVLAYRKVGWFRNAVNAVWNWIKTNWPLIVSILAGPLGLAVVQVIKHWDSIKGAATSVVNFVRTTFSGLVTFFQGIPGAVGGVFSSIFSPLKDGFVSAINFIINAWNSLKFTIPSLDLGPLGKVGGGTVGVPQIPPIGGDKPKGKPGEGNIAGPPMPHRAHGGYIPGRGRSDTQPIYGTPGEYVLKRAAADKLGPSRLAELNSGKDSGGEQHYHFYLDGKEIEASVSRTTQNRMNRK